MNHRDTGHQCATIDLDQRFAKDQADVFIIMHPQVVEGQVETKQADTTEDTGSFAMNRNSVNSSIPVEGVGGMGGALLNIILNTIDSMFKHSLCSRHVLECILGVFSSQIAHFFSKQHVSCICFEGWANMCRNCVDIVKPYCSVNRSRKMHFSKYLRISLNIVQIIIPGHPLEGMKGF